MLSGTPRYQLISSIEFDITQITTFSISISRYPEQVSHTVTLKKGQITYLEAINKQGTNSDNLSVGVELPNGDKLFPIPHDLLRKSKSAGKKESNNSAQ